MLASSVCAVATAQDVAERFRRVTATTPWVPASAVPVAFDTFHPQGFARVGEELFLSSVQVIDRANGEGRAHLFRMLPSGRLIGKLDLTDGPRYHPGGIDYDGARVWVSVAEYRPDSTSSVWAVDPIDLRADKLFTFSDHLGAITHDAQSQALIAMSWGSRTLYRWPTRVTEGGAIEAIDPDAPDVVPNPSFYVDFQDVQWIPGTTLMLCGGLKRYPHAGERGRGFTLSGLELFDTTTLTPVHQVPVPLWDEAARPMLQNPFHVEPAENGLRFYFMPADNTSTLHEYFVETENAEPAAALEVEVVE